MIRPDEDLATAGESDADAMGSGEIERLGQGQRAVFQEISNVGNVSTLSNAPNVSSIAMLFFLFFRQYCQYAVGRFFILAALFAG
jgi:hypothetical protein